MRYIGVLGTILLVALAMAPATAHADEAPIRRDILLADFSKGLEGWSYNGGWEFKGGSGSLTADATGGENGSAAVCLRGDFRKGGAYVAMTRTFKLSAESFRLRLKAPGITSLDARLIDSGGQTFQYRLPLEATDGWQTVVLQDFGKAEGHWGGAKDGKWQGPAKEMWLMLPNSVKGKQGALWLASVTATTAVRPPATMPAVAPPPPDSIFGFSAHMLHNDLFYGPTKEEPYNRLEYTLPFVVKGRFGVMREALYQGFFAGDNPEKDAQRRALVEQYLAMYQQAGVRVILCPLCSTAGGEHFTQYFQWLGDVARKYPCVAGIEIHNEPNLKFFWGGTEKQYAEACREAAKLLKARAPGVPVIVGSVSHLWWGPGVKWLQTVLKEGALEGADGLSVHPYRNQSPPEGGAMHAPENDPNGLASEITEWWGMIQRYNTANKPLKLYFTEVGYSTGKGAGLWNIEGIQGGLERQADYLSRLMLVVLDVRLRGIPLQAINWYDLKCDGNGDGTEANFGVISYDTATQRPAYTAYSRIAETFGHTSDLEPLDLPVSFSKRGEVIKSSSWRRFSDGALLVAFWRLNQLQKADEDFDSEIAVTLPEGFAQGITELCDLHEPKPRPIAPSVSGGTLRAPLRITARAAWLVIRPQKASTLSVVDEWRESLPAAFSLGTGKGTLELRGDRQVRVGDQASLSLVVDNQQGATPLQGTIVYMGKPLAFSAPAHGRATLPMTGAAENAPGAKTRYYHIRVGDTVIGRGGFTVLVDDPVAVAASPTFNSAGKLELRVRNSSQDRDVRIVGVKWSSGEQAGQEPADLAIAPGAEGMLLISMPAGKPFEPAPAKLEIALKGRAPLAWSGELGRCPCAPLTPTIDGDLAEWQQLPAIDLSSGKVAIKGYKGAADLSGRIWIGYDADNFYFAAKIEDDKFSQSYTGHDTFKGDGFQFALAPDVTGEIPAWQELGLALTREGPQVWRWIGPPDLAAGLVPGARAVIKTAGTTTTYECAVPWSQLQPVSPKQGAFRFSVLADDNDGNGRRGWIQWGSGIGYNKDPQLFRVCRFAQ